jgi:hypothetical protein
MTMRSSLRRTLWTLGGVAMLLVASGCNNCEKLTQKLCTDLGPEDCAVWKKAGLEESMIPGGRKVNSACGSMMSDAIYPNILQGTRQQVEATKKANAAMQKAQ